MTRNRIKTLTLISIIAAMSIASRFVMEEIPNVKPSTDLIIFVSMIFGIRFGFTVSALTVLVPGLFLGLGAYTPFQILAWFIISITSGLLGKYYKNIPHLLMTAYAGLCGYIYGFFVSLNILIQGGIHAFLVYWISGLPFDTLHCVGNIGFYFLLAPFFLPFLEKKRLEYYSLG